MVVARRLISQDTYLFFIMYMFPRIKVNVEESMKASLLPLQTYFAAKKPSIVLCTAGLEAQQEGTNVMNVEINHLAEA